MPSAACATGLLAAPAADLVKTGSVRPTLAFGHLLERNLAGCQNSHLRRGGEVRCRAGPQVYGHALGPISEQIIAKR